MDQKWSFSNGSGLDLGPNLVSTRLSKTQRMYGGGRKKRSFPVLSKVQSLSLTEREGVDF